MTGPLKVIGFLFGLFFFSCVRGQVKIQTPTLSLVPVITQKSTSVMCVIEDFYPKDLTVQWEVNDTNCPRQSKLEYELNAEGLYTAYSLCKVSSETWNTNTEYTCEATHQGKLISVRKNFKDKLKLTLKPPIEREIFVNNKVVLEAVVSGDDLETVIEASVSCKVKNEPVTSVRGNINFPEGTSQFIRTHYIFVDTKKWFDGEIVTCSIHDRGVNRDIKQEISFDKGDGRTPSVIIHTPDTIHTDTVSLVCEVTSPKLGDVYIMWKVGNRCYIKGLTSAPIQRDNSISVLSILTVSKQKYEDPRNTIICAVKYANMDNIGPPLQVSTSQRICPECPVCSKDYY
ncbi:hypothetical protein ABG768_020377 [Culter alburnus]|uniref:Ig-like domain-containing protein n=1 Tax=Culter alburnus TaxID=194366 RepID=A0AAW2AZX6_CULAL